MRIKNLNEVVNNLECGNYPFIIKINNNKDTFSVIATKEMWHSTPEDRYYDWSIEVEDNNVKKIAFIDAYFGEISFDDFK